MSGAPPRPRLRTVAACVALAFVPALGGWWARPDAWFSTLARPPLAPPDWLFGPVWCLLYVSIGAALALVVALPPAQRARGWAAAFAAQWLLNLLWTPVFFGLHRPGLALAVIVLLLAAIAVTMWRFARSRPLAGALLAPYAAWVAFATYLNAGYAALNHG